MRLFCGNLPRTSLRSSPSEGVLPADAGVWVPQPVWRMRRWSCACPEDHSVLSPPCAERFMTVRFTVRSQSKAPRVFVESVEFTELVYFSGEVTSLPSGQ